jgi:transposase
MEVSDMERIPYGVYSRELREEAVKLVTEAGLSIPEVGRRLSIPTSTVRNWIKRYKAGTLSEVGKDRKPLSETEMELARLRRELAEVKMERDLLKNHPKGIRLSLS